MGISAGPNSISDSLAFHIDPANPRSYAGVGTVIYDLSGNGKTSYFTNGALYQNYTKGVVVVDGNNDYISTPLFNLTSPITVSAWVKNIADDAPVFSASGAGVNYGNGEVIHYFSGKSILVGGYEASGKYFQFPQLNLNQWLHLVMTRDASNNMSVYLNGVGSTSNTQSYSYTLQMNQIGRYSAFTNIYNAKGSIGEVKIYNRALSASEVLQNYNASKKRYLPEENIVKNGLVLNIDAANPSSYAGSGNNAFDLSGFGNTATLVNGTGFGTTGGGTFNFDGSNDLISLGTRPNIDGYQLPITLSGWFYLNSLSGNKAILGIYNTVSTIYNYLRIDAATFRFFLSIDDVLYPGINLGQYQYFDYSTSLIANRWYNFAVVVAGTITSPTLTMYINAVSQTFSPVNLKSSVTLNQDYRIGANQFNGDFFNGNISQVQIYNRALSATEVMQNFNAMRERYNI